MDYTVAMERFFSRLIGGLLVLTLTACGSGLTPLATPKPDSASINRPVAPSRELQTALPEVCECILRFDHLNIEQGLSQSSIHVIFQDSRGFMWFGTQDGLNRFDGYAIEVYKPDPDRPDYLSDRWITAIVEDADGYLWIGTRQGGLNRFDPRLETFVHYMHDENDPTSLSDDHINMLYRDQANNVWVGTSAGLDRFDKTAGNFKHYLTAPSDEPYAAYVDKVTTMFQDSRGQYWLGTADTGLKKFDPINNTVTSYRSIQESPNTLSSDYVTAIVEGSFQTLWVGTRNGLNRFNPTTGRFDRFLRAGTTPQDIQPDNRPPNPSSLVLDNRSTSSLSSNSINALKVDSTGNLWVGTANGLNRYAPGNGFVQYFYDPSYSKGLSENNVISFFEDRSGILWIGTHGGGVNIYDRQRDQFAYYRHNPRDTNSLPDNFINGIYVDSQGDAWIGTQSTGVNRFSWLDNRLINYRNDPNDPESLSSNDVTSIYEDQEGILWLGTADGLNRLDADTSSFIHYRRDPNDPESLPTNYVSKVYVDSLNNVWVGTNVGLHLLDRATGKFTHYVHHSNDPASYSGGMVSDIIEDHAGNLWVGSFTSGLNLLDRDTGTFVHFQYDPQNKDSLNNDTVLSIYQDSKDRIWVGTNGGLNLFHPETKSFSFYLEKNGLANGVVYGILEDEKGNLWMSTNFGLSRFNPETETFRNFDAGDGLQSNEFNSNAYAKGLQGELYFGGVNGLTVFEPTRIADNPYAPPVVLTSLTQGDQSISTDQSVESLQAITLEYPQNSLDFYFAALSYSQPQKNQYAYFLEEFDSYWHFIGTKRDGRYTNLPGGEYTLLIKAANSDGVWNETPTRLQVTVIPPFWQTAWFRAVAVLSGALMVVSGVGLRTRSIRNRNRALEGLVNERTFALETRNREMEALYKADERILRNVSLNQVFQTLVDVAVDMLHANRSVVFAWDEKQTKVRPRVSHGYAPETLKVMEFAKGEGNVGQVLATGKPIISKTLDPESMLRPDVRAAIIAEGIRSFMHLPIVVDHKVVAVFNVAFTGPDFIDEDTVRVFSALVNRAAISIANMELFEQTKDLAVMEERNRLARDLHDSAKQKAFAALAQLGTARGILNGNGHLVATHLNEAENLVSDVIQELTFLVQEIYPIALQEKGLGNTLREYIFEWENRTDAKVQFAVRNERRLPLEVEQALFRITQEGMANVARHSQARRVVISLVYNDDSIQLSLSDDGQGFDMKTKPYGMGLRSIRERVGTIRGTVQIQSAPGQGTRLIVQVPAKG